MSKSVIIADNHFYPHEDINNLKRDSYRRRIGVRQKCEGGGRIQ